MDIGGVAWVAVHSTWARHTAPGLGGTEPSVAGSRWLRPGRPGVYLADSDETALAELYRWLAEERRAPAAAMPRDLHHVAVDSDRVADLRTERSRKALGLPRMRPTRKQWPPFQDAGERLERAGAHGILYASTARSRSACLCVLASGLGGLRLVGSPTTVLSAPPPRGLRA